MKSINQFWQEHGGLILLTFEIFWVVVFLLDRVSGCGGSAIPQFVYVNF